MGSLISYSGISTKVKAMERFRIRPEQFEAMADLGSVPEAVQFLRSNPSYEKAFSKASEKAVLVCKCRAEAFSGPLFHAL